MGPAPAPAPTTRAYLELVEVVAVFAVLHHPAKYQQASPIAHKAIGCTSRRDVPSHGRDEPLVGRWRTKVSRSQNSSGAPRTRTSTPLPPHTHQPSKYSLRKEELRHCLSSQGCGTFSFYYPSASPLSKPSSKLLGLRGHLKTACDHPASHHGRLKKQEVTDQENSSASGDVATSRHSMGHRKETSNTQNTVQGPVAAPLSGQKSYQCRLGAAACGIGWGGPWGYESISTAVSQVTVRSSPPPGPPPPPPPSRTRAEVAAVSAN